MRYEYDVSGNLAAKKNYTVKASGPDVLYYEEYLQYDEPQKTAKIREKIEKPFYEMMYLYSSSTVTNYENDGSGDIGYSYSVAIEIDYNADGWPTKSNVNVTQTHPQHKKTSAVIGYEYLQK